MDILAYYPIYMPISLYTGGIEDNQRNGWGRQVFKTGDIYEGNWLNDKPDGKGKLTLTDGSYYEGTFNEFGISEGIFRHKLGASFEGLFKYDRFMKGKFRFRDGEFFIGSWKLNKEQNVRFLVSGTLYCNDGNTIEFKGDLTRLRHRQI